MLKGRFSKLEGSGCSMGVVGSVDSATAELVLCATARSRSRLSWDAEAGGGVEREVRSAIACRRSSGVATQCLVCQLTD